MSDFVNNYPVMQKKLQKSYIFYKKNVETRHSMSMKQTNFLGKLIYKTTQYNDLLMTQSSRSNKNDYD